MKLSTVILAKNEENSIEKAIKSVQFSDEILVIDDGSTDKTKEKAQKGGAKVLSKPLLGDFAKLRNFGMSQVKGDWIFFLDADEEVNTELKHSIVSVLQNQNKIHLIDAYFIKRRDWFWGRELRHGETHSARTKGLIRLVKKNSGNWAGAVHERFQTVHKTGSLKGFIDHYPHQTIKEFLTEINSYSTLRADELRSKNKKFSLFKLLVYPPAKFIYTYILKLGFLDGAEGFVYSFMMSFYSFLVRAKLFQV